MSCLNPAATSFPVGALCISHHTLQILALCGAGNEHVLKQGTTKKLETAYSIQGAIAVNFAGIGALRNLTGDWGAARAVRLTNFGDVPSMIPTQLSRRWLTIGILSGLAVFGAAQAVDPNLYSALQWRNIGPFRAGRISAVSGAIGQPGVYYAGMPMGGVWKTTSAGVTWYPIFDDVKTCSSVGAVEVAPSDPNIIYVGMGDMVAGGSIAEGDGIYKSTDAGKTWTHMGLDTSKQIPSILVDPKNPDLVLACVQGNRFTKNEDRGVFRSTDGGKTWAKTLYIDDQTGAQKIAWAYDNPSVMLATTVRHYQQPGGAARGGGGGFGGGGGGGATSSTKLFKSTDEGLTWKEITGGGLPDLAGRTCVAIANGTNSQRMYLVQNSGLFRSDDGGTTWRQMDEKDARVRNGQGGYNCGVYVNQKNPDIVYVVNTCSYISRDGGETFTGFKGAPGGDDPQQMWLDPTDADRLFLGMDQGATVSQDGGKTWSLWYNQINAQMYHMSVDNQFPYWVYGTEQDSGSVATASRGNFGAITPLDWLPHPGYEFGSIVADPINPKVSFAGGPGRGIVKVTYPSGQWVNVSPNADSKLRLRQVGNQPLSFNPNNPKELMAGFQCLMSTTDGGMHWKKLSPDLGYPKGVNPPEEEAAAGRRGGGNSISEEEEAAEFIKGQMKDPNFVPEGDADEMEVMQGAGNGGGSIESFSVSDVAPGTMWVGTNNGLIKVTKNRGKTWEDVTIPNLPLPTRADISGIDASHHDAGTAYVAIDYHNVGDFKPYLYRTHDYGKTWTPIINGLPTDLVSGSFTRVIKSDTKKEGLLFAGTESSVYVSFNDGDTWQPLTQNLPNTSYRDLAIKDNDLVACTYGRGFWVLDDFSPLREMTPAIAAEPAHLFKPGDAYRVRKNVNGDTPYPPEVPHAPNPPDGAIIYYHLGAVPSGDISVDIYDSAGKPVRHLSSAPIPPMDEPAPPIPDFWVASLKPLPAMAGMSRVNWDLRYDAPPAFEHSYEINANPGGTYPSPEGPLAIPGVYTAKLTVNGKTYSQSFTVKNDPRSPATAGELASQHAIQMKCYEGSMEARQGYDQVTAMRAVVADISKANPTGEVAEAAKAFDDKLAAIGGSGAGRRFGGRGGGGSTAPTFAGVTRTMIGHVGDLDTGDMAPNEAMVHACDDTMVDLNTVEWNWLQLNAKELSDFNAVLTKNGLKTLSPALGVGHPKEPPKPKLEKKKEEAKKTD